MSAPIRKFEPKGELMPKPLESPENKVTGMDKVTETHKAERIPHFAPTDAGNAYLFMYVHGENLRWERNSGKWLVWDDIRWVVDEDGETVRQFIQLMFEGAKTCGKEYSEWLLNSTNNPKIKNALEVARSVSGTTIGADQLDQDPWLIGTQNGVVDLRKGSAIEPKREHLMTKQMGTIYDENATCPLWEEFVQTAAQGDLELVDYLQTAVGYSLTGVTTEQCLFFLHGGGNNGKGVFSETISALFGDYSQTAPESVFSKQGGSGIPTEIARLVGTRLVIAPELGQNMEFHESRIKAMTGDDTITARYLYEDFFDFKPTHTFWISGNHKPKIVGTDDGIWRRFRLLPFLNQVKPEDKDPNLKDKLLRELPGILNWAISGCLKWQEQGKLITPQCVLNATDGYRQEEDQVGRFLADKTITADPRARVKTLVLYEAYCTWTEDEGMMMHEKLTLQGFKKAMTARGYDEPIKSKGNKNWCGLELIEDRTY